MPLTSQIISLSPQKIRQRIGFQPHEKQAEILANLKRFNVISGGKRVGKTILVAYLALKELLSTNRKIWIVAPTYDLAKRSFDYLDFWAKRFFRDVITIYQAPEPIAEFALGSKVWIKSAENEKSLLGQGLDLLIMDEAARIDQDVWERYLRPNLIDRNGKALMIGNPWGKNWFYDQFLMKNSDPDYFSYWLPTAIENEAGEIIGSNNPAHVSVEELKRIKETTPEDVWAQEYLAKFLEGAGQVFRNVKDCIAGELEEPKRDHVYTLGADLGRLTDFTVLIVLDRMTRRVVAMERYKEVDWLVQKARIANLSRKYNDAIVCIDSTGLGDPIVEDLRGQSLVIEDFKYTKSSKRKLIDKLSLFIERRGITFPKIEVLIDELESFSFERTKGGNVKYFPPSNKHDDCVNALALAVWPLMEAADEPLDELLQAEGIFRPPRNSFR